MKSLRESIFDKDLVTKEFNFFDLYYWNYGFVNVSNFISWDELIDNKVKKKLETLSVPEKLKSASQTENLILKQLYYALLNTGTEKDFKKWRTEISNSIFDVLNRKTYVNGGYRCLVYPSSVKPKTVSDPGISCIEFKFPLNFKIDDGEVLVDVNISLKRKH